MSTETYHAAGNSTVYTYGWMYKNAKNCLEKARTEKEGEFFSVMTCIVFSAFTVEAYFNHLGSKIFDDWDKRERKLSKKKKMKFLSEKVGLTLDLDERPYSSVLEAFGYRDTLAHGRTENYTKSVTVEVENENDLAFLIKSGWFEYTEEVENAERIFNDMVSFVTELNQAAGLGAYPFVSFFSESYSKTKVE